MKNLTKIIIISTTGLLISASLLIFLIEPTIKNLADLNSDAIQRKTDLKTLDEQIVAYRNSQKDLAVASEKGKIINSFVVKEGLEVPIKKIEEAASKTSTDQSLNIRENDIAVAGTTYVPLIKNEGKIEEVPYTISTTSDFVSLIKFLEYLEHMPNFSEVSKISLSAVTGGQTKENLPIHTGNILGIIDGVFFVKKQ